MSYVRVPLLDIFEIFSFPMGLSIAFSLILGNHARLWLIQPPRNLCDHLPISNILINSIYIVSIVLFKILMFSVLFYHHLTYFLEKPQQMQVFQHIKRMKWFSYGKQVDHSTSSNCSYPNSNLHKVERNWIKLHYIWICYLKPVVGLLSLIFWPGGAELVGICLSKVSQNILLIWAWVAKTSDKSIAFWLAGATLSGFVLPDLGLSPGFY